MKNAQGTYEVMDGQQRTISFCQYVIGDFSVPVDGHPMAFHNLPVDVRRTDREDLAQRWPAWVRL